LDTFSPERKYNKSLSGSKAATSPFAVPGVLVADGAASSFTDRGAPRSESEINDCRGQSHLNFGTHCTLAVSAPGGARARGPYKGSQGGFAANIRTDKSEFVVRSTEKEVAPGGKLMYNVSVEIWANAQNMEECHHV